MAIRNTASLPGQLRSTDRLPSRTRCVVQCVEEIFEAPQGKNPRIVRTWEVRIPEAVEIDGQMKVLAGTTVKQYLPTIMLDSAGKRLDGKSDAALARLRDENKALGLPFEAIDDENPDLLAKGIYADANFGSEEYTPSGAEPGTKAYRVKLEGILCKATPVAGQPW